MKTSQNGIDMIKKYEGCRLKSYKLPNEKFYTIGYGHYSSKNYAGQQITQAEAENLLKNDLNRSNFPEFLIFKPYIYIYVYVLFVI